MLNLWVVGWWNTGRLLPVTGFSLNPHFNNQDTWVLAGFTGILILAASVRDRMRASRPTVLEIPQYRDIAITESLRLPPGARWYLHTMENCKTEFQE